VDDGGTRGAHRSTLGDVDDQLAELLRRQHGVVTRSQALAAGLTRHGIAHRLQRGWWRRVLPATYVVVGQDEGDATRWWGALLWAPPGSVLSHDTAAAMQRLPVLRPDARVHVTTADRGDSRAPPGLRLHRPRRLLAPADRAVSGGLAITAIARTAVDLAATLAREQQVGFLVACRQQRRMSYADLLAAAGRHSPRLQAIVGSIDPTVDSGSELEAGRLLGASGLPVEFQVAVRLSATVVVHLDLGIRASRIAIEVDGTRYHSSVEAALRDRERDELLRLAGWEVVRVMPHELREPAAFVARVWRLHALRSTPLAG
jgi:hypothetical protein